MKERINDIDNLLKGDGQQSIAKAVASLPDEPLSLVWRSNLNEVLREKAVSTKRKRWFINVLSPVAGLGLACALAGIVMIRPSAGIVQSPSVVLNAPSLEASLVQLHQDDLRSSDVAGTGLNPTEAMNYASAGRSDSTDDSEDDLEF